MKKTKEQKGITLIALIITIVVLLILAVVAINAIKGDGILKYAENARDDYQTAQDNETSTLDGYVSKIEDSLSSGTKIGKATIDTIVDENSTINGEAYSSNNPIIPAGFKAINVTGDNASSWDAESGPEVSKGLVISDENSEFVWVPVTNINDMIMCQTHGASVSLDEETLQCPTCGDSTKLAGKLYATSAGNNFSSTLTGQTYELNTGLREPDILTDFDNSGGSRDYDENLVDYLLEGEYAKTQTVASFKAQLQNEFDNMAKSVAKYGGFYVGRYETSLTAEKTVQSKYGENSTISDMGYPYTWTPYYVYSKRYVNTKTSIRSSMIWGSQYDAMMRWIANGDDTIVKSDIGDNRNTTGKTGTVSTDILNNVYDLYGNNYEWTLEAVDNSGRALRGGACDFAFAPSYKQYGNFYYGGDGMVAGLEASRLTLYVL